MEETDFKNFRKNLLIDLKNDDWRTKPCFYMCSSFHEVFVNIFHTIYSIEFKEDETENEQSKRQLKGYHISDMFDYACTDEEIKALHIIINKIGGTKAAKISTPRGNAYMIFGDHHYSNKRMENNDTIKIFSNSPTGKDVHIPRLIINQIAPKTYAILPLKNIKEIEFEVNKYLFSFGLAGCDSPMFSGIGDIFFFNDSGLEFSRINIIDVFNSQKEKIELIGNTFGKSNLKSLNITLFQESSFTYKVGVHEVAYAGYLRERDSKFSGRIDLTTNNWLSIEGASRLDDYK